MRAPALRYLIVILPLLAALGCSFTEPTLHAHAIPSVPFPNGRVESAIWNQAPEIIVSAYRDTGGSRERRKIKLRAIHDGQALSILASWMDETESLDRQNWLWDEQHNDYQLAVYAVDQCSIEWPLCEHPGFCMLTDHEEKYDLWTWRAGWTNFSGYAEDETVQITPHPLGTHPQDVKGGLYPQPGGKALVEIQIIPDSGKPGSFTHPKPFKKAQLRATAVGSDYPQGSAGDVQAYGVYSKGFTTPATPDQQVEDFHTPGYWYKEKFGRYKESSWFVEFYRLFVTKTPAEDYQIDPSGVNEFAMAIHDQSDKGEHFTTGPIRLRLDKLKELKATLPN